MSGSVFEVALLVRFPSMQNMQHIRGRGWGVVEEKDSQERAFVAVADPTTRLRHGRGREGGRYAGRERG